MLEFGSNSNSANMPTVTKKSKTRFKRPVKKRGKKASSRKRLLPRSSPAKAPSAYFFNRAYDYVIGMGTADASNHVYVNTDGKYMIIKLFTTMSMLPDHAEFRPLFNQYKITRVNHRLVPDYKNNIPGSLQTPSAPQAAIPNYEIFIIPVRYRATDPQLETLGASDIDAYLNQSQRCSKRLMPSGVQTFVNTRPMIRQQATDNTFGVDQTTLEAAKWFPTSGTSNPMDVAHFGYQIAIRRVDGQAFAALANQLMGFRMENRVHFCMRSVQ